MSFYFPCIGIQNFYLFLYIQTTSIVKSSITIIAIVKAIYVITSSCSSASPVLLSFIGGAIVDTSPAEGEVLRVICVVFGGVVLFVVVGGGSVVVVVVVLVGVVVVLVGVVVVVVGFVVVVVGVVVVVMVGGGGVVKRLLGSEGSL